VLSPAASFLWIAIVAPVFSRMVGMAVGQESQPDVAGPDAVLLARLENRVFAPRRSGVHEHHTFLPHDERGGHPEADWNDLKRIVC